MTARRTRLPAAVALVGALVLSGCSGLLGGAAEPSPVASATDVASPPASNTAAPTPTFDPPEETATAADPESSSTIEGDQPPAEWVDALAALNEARVAAGTAPLRYDERLAAIAQPQAAVYASGVEGWEAFSADLEAAGFAHGSARVASAQSASEAMSGWVADPENSASLLDALPGSVGVGSAPWQGTRIWVLVAGYRADDGRIPSGSLGAEEVLTLTNAQRAQGGLADLTLSEQLNAAAQAQADHQAAILEMTHDGGGGLGERVAAAGYDARVAAENVAVGQTSIAQVVQGWVDSPGHYANIMNGDVQEMGFAVAFGADGRAYFAQVFGAPM